MGARGPSPRGSGMEPIGGSGHSCGQSWVGELEGRRKDGRLTALRPEFILIWGAGVMFAKGPLSAWAWGWKWGGAVTFLGSVFTVSFFLLLFLYFSLGGESGFLFCAVSGSSPRGGRRSRAWPPGAWLRVALHVSGGSCRVPGWFYAQRSEGRPLRRPFRLAGVGAGKAGQGQGAPAGAREPGFPRVFAFGGLILALRVQFKEGRLTREVNSGGDGCSPCALGTAGAPLGAGRGEGRAEGRPR